MSYHLISKGHHRSNKSWFPRIHFGKRKHSYVITFFNGCKYDLDGPDQLDINKLFGISYGMHHTNSVRFGWRWDLRKEMVEILAYVYVDGKWITENEADLHIGFVHPGMPYEYAIEVRPDSYMLRMESSLFKTIDVVTIKHNKLTWWGYKLYPYFGGNQVAPSDVHILLKTCKI